MKKWIIIILSFAVLILTIIIMGIAIKNQKTVIDRSLQNIAAYSAETDSLNNKCKLFQFRILEIENSNDSLLQKMYQQAKIIGAKDRQIKGLQYQLDHIEKTEIIYVKDTIFKEPSFILDTCVTDKWSSVCIHLEHPNKIEVNTTFDNEVFTTIHWKKVPIKPRKCKVAEWFTRKRKEITVDVYTDNPYVENKVQRFVQIVD